jgi:Zn-dependent protease with chaperone function
MSPQYRQSFDVLKKLESPITPTQLTFGYRLGIGVVSVLMVLLPLIYLLLIGVVAYGIYYHAINHTDILMAGRGRGASMAILAYLAPIFIGVTVIFFMLKPLFAKSEKPPTLAVLTAEQEPLLYAFVERICRAVNAPMPREIVLDNQVNASASFRRGVWSMFSNDLRLTIGTPLVAGMTTQQFAGVLAHEFGHFAQGAGMRLSYLIRTISHWLTAAVYERDQWDARLIEWCNTDIRISWIAYLTRGVVWLIRRVLWVLMYAGHLVSSYLLRQMEFDADRYETRLSGSETFAQTSQRLTQLSVAHRVALDDLSDFYREGRLGNNFPKLINLNVNKFDEDTLRKIREFDQQQTAGLFDTHPTNRERIASAKRENTAGVFQDDRPASVLFRDFDATAVHTTLLFYREVFGQAFDWKAVHDVEELVEKQRVANLAFESLNRVTQGSYSFMRPLTLGAVKLPTPVPVTAAKKKLLELRGNIESGAARYAQLADQWSETGSKRVQVAQSCLLQKAGFKIPKSLFDPPLINQSQCDAAWNATHLSRETLQGQMTTYEEALAKRINLTLGVLFHVSDDEFPGRELLYGIATRMCGSYTAMREQVEAVISVRERFAALVLLLENCSDGVPSQVCFDTLKELIQELKGLLLGIRTDLKDRKYPFDHANKEIRIGEFLVSELPPDDDLGPILSAVERLLEEFPRLYVRVFGQICWVCEQVETWLELPLAAEPAKRETEAE